MKNQFKFAEDTFEIYTNGKNYNGYQYVDVSRVGGYRNSRMDGKWDIEAKAWKKQPGGPWFNEAVAKAAGLIEEPIVKKPRAKKAASPVVAAMQLPEGKKVRLFRGKLVIK